MSKIRTFIAIEIPEEIRNKIGELQNNLKGIGGRISWTKPGNIHLTLKFLGDTDEGVINEIAAELQQAVQDIADFKVTVKETGTFPNFKRPRVIWIGAESEGGQLQKLATQIEQCMENFGFKKENRRFSAHLTLGRVKDAKGIQPVIDKLKSYENFEAGSFTVKEFYLIKSELHTAGAIYTPLKKIVLKKQQ
jgi:2'-5' RNA ligase